MADIASKYLKKDALQFFISQIKTAKESQYGFRWSDENKLFALTLLYRSSKGYKFLEEHFLLPSVRTLQKFIEGVHLQAGFTNEIIALLKEKVKNFSKSELLINICMDEMSIMSNLFYELNKDKILGFEDLGNGARSNTIATSVMVVMISGMASSFKQPIAYFFSRKHGGK